MKLIIILGASVSQDGGHETLKGFTLDRERISATTLGFAILELRNNINKGRWYKGEYMPNEVTLGKEKSKVIQSISDVLFVGDSQSCWETLLENPQIYIREEYEEVLCDMEEHFNYEKTHNTSLFLPVLGEIMKDHTHEYQLECSYRLLDSWEEIENLKETECIWVLPQTDTPANYFHSVSAAKKTGMPVFMSTTNPQNVINSYDVELVIP